MITTFVYNALGCPFIFFCFTPSSYSNSHAPPPPTPAHTTNSLKQVTPNTPRLLLCHPSSPLPRPQHLQRSLHLSQKHLYTVRHRDQPALPHLRGHALGKRSVFNHRQDCLSFIVEHHGRSDYFTFHQSSGRPIGKIFDRGNKFHLLVNCSFGAQ